MNIWKNKIVEVNEEHKKIVWYLEEGSVMVAKFDDERCRQCGKDLHWMSERVKNRIYKILSILKNPKYNMSLCLTCTLNRIEEDIPKYLRN